MTVLLNKMDLPGSMCTLLKEDAIKV